MVNGEFVIRDAVIDDQEMIAKRNKATAKETESWSLDSETVIKGVEAVLRDTSKGFYLIIEYDGESIGQCLITREWSDWRCGDFWWIQSVFVDEPFRQKGAFSFLFSEVLRRARSSKDVVGLRLYVNRSNKPAKYAYSALGMKESEYDLLEIDFIKSPEAKER